MVKRGGFVVFILFAFIILAGFAEARVDYHNESLKRNYFGGEKIIGKINLTIVGESADSLVKSNFPGQITLLELLRKNGLSLEEDYNCSLRECLSDYAIKNDLSGFNLNTDKIVGIKISGEDIRNIGGFKLKIDSNIPPSCEPQLIVDILNNGSRQITNKKYTNEVCSAKNFGCFATNLQTSTYTSFTVIGNRVCEEVSLSPAPAYKIGAKVKDSTNGKKANLTMILVDMDNRQLGNCTLPRITQTEEEVGCIVEYGSVVQKTYRVCLRNPEYSSDGANYAIRTENSETICGTDDDGLTRRRDYEIFAQTLKFDGFSVELNNSLFLSRFGETIDNAINNYVDSKYDSDCIPDCIIPIKFSGKEQSITLSNAQISYMVGNSMPAPEQTKVYALEEEAPKIYSNQLLLELSNASFTIPVTSSDLNFDFYIGGNKITRIPISVTSSFDFEISPKFVLLGLNNKFEVLTSNNITQSSWDFGDGNAKENVNGRSANHRYLESKDYNVQVEVTRTDGKTARKNFIVTAGNASESAKRLILKYEQRMINLSRQIAALNPIIADAVKKKINFVELNASFSKIKYDYSNNASDINYTGIVNRLVELNIPYSVVASSKSGRIPLLVGTNNINLGYIKDISNKPNEELDEQAALEAIVGWNIENYNSQAEFQTISQWTESSGKEALLTWIKLYITSKKNSPDSGYIIINYPVESIKFNGDYGEKAIESGTYIPISGQKEIEFIVPEEVKIEELGMYISPEISKLDIRTGGIGWVEPPKFNSPLFFVLVGILLLVFLVVYVILQEWYKKNYESSLFKSRDELYNLINFIYNSRFSNMADAQIRKKLSGTGWNGEQINYAFKKIDGKRTGMFEIPIFKMRENRIVKEEIAKRQGDARFIKR